MIRLHFKAALLLLIILPSKQLTEALVVFKKPLGFAAYPYLVQGWQIHCKNATLVTACSAMSKFKQREQFVDRFKSSIHLFRRRIKDQWMWTLQDLRENPYQYFTIPIVAALVGYITNWLGVSMLFYPIQWRGIPIKRWPNQPVGLIGWQGIVPVKRQQMAATMVDVTINRLLKITSIFSKLNPVTLASLLVPSVAKTVYKGLVPPAVLQHYLSKVVSDLISNVESIIDIRSLIITGMTTDPKVLGSFFQRVGSKELSFLVESGTYFGFALGMLQMVQWMLFPVNWTLPISGALVGYVTNWIALKMIFEPLVPTKLGPFVLQGLFLTRQKEVSAEFCSYLSTNVLNSKEMWRSIFQGKSLLAFKALIARNLPFLSPADIAAILVKLKQELVDGAASAAHPLHQYTNGKLDLKRTLIKKMTKLSPVEFERVLHPIFQEDELTLILAGGVLGMAAGFAQWWINVAIEKRRQRKAAPLAASVGQAIIAAPSLQIDVQRDADESQGQGDDEVTGPSPPLESIAPISNNDANNKIIE
jgi:uncharacterized membrane protein YheB (UPF0754 family)